MRLNALTYPTVLGELRDEYTSRAIALRDGATLLERTGAGHGAAALRGRARGYEEAAQAVDSLLARNEVPVWPDGIPPSIAARRQLTLVQPAL